MFTSDNEFIPIALHNFDSSIERPSSLDCLCGKDTTFGRHPGNRLFREQILAALPTFMRATSKPEKMKITKSILEYMKHKGSRFLKLRNNGSWVEIDRQAARDKVSHALRFAARQRKEQLRAPKEEAQEQESFSFLTTEQDTSSFDPIPFSSNIPSEPSLEIEMNLPAQVDDDLQEEKVVLPHLVRGFYPISDSGSLGPLSKRARCDSLGTVQQVLDEHQHRRSSSKLSFDVDEIFAHDVSELIAL